jgi:hypothetical protein
MPSLTEKTLEIVEKIKAQQVAEKAYTTSLGLNWYDLEPAAKLLYPVITPLRNMIPRVSGDGGNAVNWKAITGVDTTQQSPGVSEGNRGAVITTTEADYTAPYRGLGQEDYETFEAEYGSKNFDNLRALMTEGLLNSLMIAEEKVILGGNGSDGIALGTPATPVGVLTAGGAMTAQATVCYVVALTLDGYLRSTVSAAGVPQTFNKTNADGTVDNNINAGSSQKSAEAAPITTAGGNLAITWTVTAVKGAVAYAWYTGLTGAANCKLAAITTTNVFAQTANAGGANQAASAITADCSKNAMIFSGIITQALAGAGYWASLDNGTLNADGAGGVTEIETALKSFWDNYRVSPNIIMVNSQELLNISKKVIAGGAAPLFRFVADAQNSGLNITAGNVVGNYFNKYAMDGGQLIKSCCIRTCRLDSCCSTPTALLIRRAKFQTFFR